MAAAPVNPYGKNCRAYTLLEVLLVCALVAVLLTLAAPSYHHVKLRAHRAEAMASLLEIAGCQERLRHTFGAYDTTACQRLATARYQFRIEPPNLVRSATYTVLARPIGSQQDDRCGSLSLNYLGQKAISAQGITVGQCWSAR